MAKSNKVFSGLFWVYLENTTTQVISFVVTIILARLLDPSHYGTIALLNVFIAIAQVFVTSGISSALIQKKNADELDYSTMFWFNLSVSFFLYIILFVIAPVVGDFYNNDQLAIILRILSLSIPLSAYNCIQQAYVSSHMIFKKSFMSSSGGSVLSGIIGIVMAYNGYGLWALVAQRILHVAFNTILLKLAVDWYPKMMYSWNRLKPLLSFGWKMMATGFLFTTYSQLRSLVIGKRYSAADLGYYERGFSFPSLIAANIDSTITRVLYPTLAQSESTSLAEKLRLSSQTSAFIMTPILWGMAIIASPLVELLLGEKWLQCVPYVQIMCFVWWLQPTQSCSAQAIKAIGRSDIYLYIEVASKILGLLLLLIAVFVYDSVLAIAIMYFIGQTLSVFIYGRYSEKYIGYKIKDQIIDIIKPASYSFVMCAAIYPLSIIINNSLFCVVLQIITSIVIYFGLSSLLKDKIFYYIIKSIKKILK